MTSFCRLCAEEREPSEIITTINDSSRLVEQKLIACCQWDPQTTEYKLPQDVCVVCLDKLEKSWLFSQSVKRAQRKIHDFFESANANTKSPKKPAKTRFECTVCLSNFLSRIALERHDCVLIPSTFQCELCQKMFKTNELLQSHFLKQEMYKCTVCMQVFCSERKLNHHKANVCRETTEMGDCDEIESKPAFVDCNFTVDPEQEIEQELAADLEPEPNEEPSNSSDSIPLRLEIDVDVSMKPAKSKPKKTKFVKPPNENDLDDKQYECHLCNKRFAKFPSLKYHMFVHTLPRKYKCQYCNNTFRTERHYTSHQRKHIDYFCDTCHKKFDSAFALKVHKRMHVGASVKMFGCKECDHYFIDVSTFYNHMKRRHGLDSVTAKQRAILIEPNGSAKPFVCEQCGKDFFDRSSLAAHAVIHLDIRPFQCTFCPKAFKNKYNLKAHKETHTGKKLVQCTECGKRYSAKSALMKHQEEHTGVFTRTFPCDFCDRIFRNSYNMQVHRRTHTGEKPYKCDVCNHAMTTKSQLDRHLKTISHIAKANDAMGIQQSPDVV